MREAHFPGRAPIEAYGNGGFRFAGMSHRGSLLCLPSGIYGWEPKDAASLAADDLGRIFAEVKRRPLYLIGERVGFEARTVDHPRGDALPPLIR